MIDNPDKAKNTIKLFERNKDKEGIKTIIQEMIGSNKDRANKFRDAQLLIDPFPLDTAFGVDQCTILDKLLEGDQIRPIQVILDYMMAQEHSAMRSQAIIGQLMNINEKRLCQNIIPFFAEHDPDNSDHTEQTVKLESHILHEFKDFLGEPNIVSLRNNPQI